MLRRMQMLQLLTVAALVFYVVAILGCGSSSAAGRASAVPGGTSLQIAETDEGFEPGTVVVERGQSVQVTFTNAGKQIHNLRIAGGSQFGGSNDFVLGSPVVQPGEKASGVWTAPNAAGKRVFRCDVHPNHTGTITVR